MVADPMPENGLLLFDPLDLSPTVLHVGGPALLAGRPAVQHRSPAKQIVYLAAAAAEGIVAPKARDPGRRSAHLRQCF